MSKIFTSMVTFLKKRWKLLLVLIVVLGGLWMWQQSKAAGSDELNFVEVKRGDITSSITISGRIDAKEKARLRFIAGGKVVYLGAKEGDWVNKWQSIATIDRAAMQKQLQQDLNLYMKERYDFEEVRDDIKDRVLDTSENRQVAKDQLDLNNQVLNVEIQSIGIANTTLSAPFAGVLTVAPTAVAGVQLSPTDYFEVVNPETLIFRAAIDEIDLHRVSLGQASEIVLDAYEDETINSNLSYISYISSESSSGTVFLMEFPLAGADLSKYRLGMNGDALITIDKKENVLMVPIDAISEREGKVFVQIKADNKEQFQEREIEIGLENEDDVEVISGLVEGDQILLPE